MHDDEAEKLPVYYGQILMICRFPNSDTPEELYVVLKFLKQVHDKALEHPVLPYLWLKETQEIGIFSVESIQDKVHIVPDFDHSDGSRFFVNNKIFF
jgi:hypothetical protein